MTKQRKQIDLDKEVIKALKIQAAQQDAGSLKSFMEQVLINQAKK